MPFIDGIWIENQKKSEDLIKIYKKNVSLSFIRANDINKEYKIVFAVTVMSPEYNFNSPYIINKIDMDSLKQSIISNIHESDREYVILEKFTYRFATFKFLWKKWFKDSLEGVKPQTHLSKFERVFNFKKQLPRIMVYNFSPYTGQFIVNRFKELISENKMHNWFDGFIPKDYQQKINIKISNMFDYQYDNQYNRMILRLKNQYILGMLFSLGYGISASQQQKQPYIKVDFEKKVKEKIKKFDRNKWEAFIKNKFF